MRVIQSKSVIFFKTGGGGGRARRAGPGSAFVLVPAIYTSIGLDFFFVYKHDYSDVFYIKHDYFIYFDSFPLALFMKDIFFNIII